MTEENGYYEEEWPDDGRTDFPGDGYRVDFNETMNSGLSWDEVYDKSIDELLNIEDAGGLKVITGEWNDPLFTESFTIYGSYLKETFYLGYGDDIIYDNIDGYRVEDTGPDRIAGGGGNDTYYINDANTEISEWFQEFPSGEPDTTGVDAGGIDTVVASVDYELPELVENLTLVGSGSTGIGNAAANVMKGGSSLIGLGGNDLLSGGYQLDGGDGSDVLTGGASMRGGAGADIFVFRANEAGGKIRISDFSSSDAFLTDVKLFDSNKDGVISAGKDKQFALGDGRFVKVTNSSNATTTKLEYDGSIVMDGVEFFVYSTVKSAGTLAMVDLRGFDLDSF